MFVRAYLRASTTQQDALRAKSQLETFAEQMGVAIAGFYAEHESGASLKRPELFRLLDDCRPGDALLVEQIDRLSRLDDSDWRKLRQKIEDRQVRIVALDLPTSHGMFSKSDDPFTARVLQAVNGLLLDVLAAVARKDYEDRRRRQSQGIAKAKQNGKYQGRREDTDRNEAITKMLKNGMSWSDVTKATGCSRSTILRLSRRLKSEAAS